MTFLQDLINSFVLVVSLTKDPGKSKHIYICFFILYPKFALILINCNFSCRRLLLFNQHWLVYQVHPLKLEVHCLRKNTCTYPLTYLFNWLRKTRAHFLNSYKDYEKRMNIANPITNLWWISVCLPSLLSFSIASSRHTKPSSVFYISFPLLQLFFFASSFPLFFISS